MGTTNSNEDPSEGVRAPGEGSSDDSQDLDSSENNSNANTTTSNEAAGLLFRRRPFVSRHRKELDRIAEDSTRQQRYPVPDHSDEANESEDVRSFISRFFVSARIAWKSRSRSDWAEVLVPAIKWLKKYDFRGTLLKDIIAGVTVGVMVIPAGMSFALLAGLPVEYGLYTAFMPPLLYALYGSSRQLSVGGTSIISLLTGTGLAKVMEKLNIEEGAANYQPTYNILAVQLSILVGIINLAMGLVRLGFVAVFLSNAVVSGFTTGASVIIGLGQLKHILGYKIPRADVVYELLYYIFKDISQTNWRTVLMGTLSMAVIVGMKHYAKKYPSQKWVGPLGPLTVSVIAIVLVVALNLQDRGIPIVGLIPQGLPNFTGDELFPVEGFSSLFVTVIAIVLVGFVESVGLAKRFAAKHKYEVDASQELVALGMANVVGGLFQAYPSTGSFSRTAVNDAAGAQTQLAGPIQAVLVSLVLLFLTSVFEKLPMNTLAAIVIVGVSSLFDYQEGFYLWKIHKFDFSVWALAALGVMFLGVEIGLGIAVVVSLLLVIYESAYPHTAVLGRLPGTSVYRNVKQFPEGERFDGIVMVRIDAPLYFANCLHAREKIRKYRQAAEEELAQRDLGTVKFLILELSPVSHIDSTALHMLTDMYENHKSRGQRIMYCNPQVKVMERLVKSGFADKVGREHFFVFLHDAVNWCLRQMDSEAVSMHETDICGVDDLEEGTRERSSDDLDSQPATV